MQLQNHSLQLPASDRTLIVKLSRSLPASMGAHPSNGVASKTNVTMKVFKADAGWVRLSSASAHQGTRSLKQIIRHSNTGEHGIGIRHPEAT